VPKVVLNAAGIAELERTLPFLGQINDGLDRRSGQVLHWLLRAWPEHESVSKFLALFVGMELALRDITDPERTERQRQRFDKVVADIGEHATDGDRDDLLKLMREIKGDVMRIPLAAKFRILAEEAGYADVERDIEAMQQFNQVRNGVMHEGRPHVVT